MSTRWRLLMACLRGVRSGRPSPFVLLAPAIFKRSPRRIWSITSFRAMRQEQVPCRADCEPSPPARLLDTRRDHSHIGPKRTGEMNDPRFHTERSAQVRDGADMNRRDFLVAGAGAGAAGLIRANETRGATPRLADAYTAHGQVTRRPASRFKLSVTRWPYRQFTLDQLSQMAKELRIDSVELLEPDEWAIPRRYGLTCAMGYATVPDARTRLTQGFNRVSNHAWLIPAYQRAIPLAAAAGVPNLICFSGSRAGMDDVAGREACARGLAPLLPLAERHGVTLCMELL